MYWFTSTWPSRCQDVVTTVSLHSTSRGSSDNLSSLSRVTLKLKPSEKRNKQPAQSSWKRIQSQSSWGPSSNVSMSQSLSSTALSQGSLGYGPHVPKASHFMTIQLWSPWHGPHCKTLPLRFHQHMEKHQISCPNTSKLLH